MSYSFKSLGMTEAEVFGHDDTNEEGHVTGGFAASPRTNEETSRLIHNPDHPTHFAIRWQDGPIDREAGEGLNGACVEDVLEVCARRLEAYEESPLRNLETQFARNHIRMAIEHLLKRRRARREQGVEGTYQPHEAQADETPPSADAPPPIGLPKWQSHKVVEAGLIMGIAELDAGGAILNLQFPDGDGVEIDVNQLYMDKHQPQIGGYYVRYPGDGYESWSPAEAFEDGYTLLDEGREDPPPPPENPDPVPVQRPSIGRIVHYNDGPVMTVDGEEDRWLAGIICHVHSDTCINAVFWDENGLTRSRLSIEQGERRDEWRWPPRV